MVRVSVPGQDSRSLGSGTLIYVTEEHGLVLTNWHVVQDATGPVDIVFPDGFRSGGTVIKVDREWDLAAIGIWRPRVEPVRLSDRSPQPGERLTIAGYGSGSYRSASGRCMQYLSPGHGQPFEIVELGAEARQGDSGGPIFNERGELAGVLLGAAEGRTVGSYCGRVGSFLANVMPVLDHQQKEMIANAESNPSEEVDRKLATLPRGRAGAAPSGGSSVPNPSLGESTPAGARSVIRGEAERLAARRGEANHLVADDMVAIEEESPWESSPSWPSSANQTTGPSRLADSRADRRSSSSTTERGPAVLAADAPQAVALHELLGKSPIDQAKTFLAIFGVVSLLYFIVRSLRG